MSPSVRTLVLNVIQSRATSRALLGTVLVVLASSSVQISAALSHSLFDRLGPLGVSGLRFAIAALVMLLLMRPRIAGRSRAEWFSIVLYGLSIAAMNVFMYQALSFLPLGVAITMEFLGPFAIALLASRRPRQALFAIIGLVGIILIVRPTATFDMVGIVCGALAAASLAGYIVIADRIGRRGGGSPELALALCVAAAVTSPFAVTAAGSVVLGDLPILAASALLGVVLAFSVDFLAVKVAGARAVAILLSLDPVLAAIIGATTLGEHLDGITLVGMVCVSVAGGLATFTRNTASAKRTRGVVHESKPIEGHAL
ncbi:inner membrane transporter RhtA [Microbacteriaceae bacterium SG_E_30_P1]|uniref:Inner membrane transporter RhtA n=1 Tax=Antiquaquibacter oligotrophicus TaxID=2880260 RepID=A0ABT6KKD6_9MICO|nr:EamA family transporter [Antiquaquibacter oligotrophicus]MDH6180465.1 inner membrane transporter RhtA [Antiquaquibacter oligotrophicus]UDF13797.1 EamA family transporter [Antiquaquibacter oligotrophicus]